MHPALFWLIGGIVLLILEMAVGSFFLMWIGAAALLTALLALLVSAMWAQWLFFVFVALVLLILTRPMAHKLHARVVVPSNVDSLIGQEGVVLEAIDPVANTGRVRIGSEEWRARSDTTIAAGEKIVVQAIEGTTLRVQRPQ